MGIDYPFDLGVGQAKQKALAEVMGLGLGRLEEDQRTWKREVATERRGVERYKRLRDHGFFDRGR